MRAQGHAASNVLTNALAERAADIIEGAITFAYNELCQKRELRQYGQKTWQENHDGGTQNIMDVGAYRYATGSTRAAPMLPGAQGLAMPVERRPSLTYQGTTQPGMWENMTTALAPHVNTASQYTQSAFAQAHQSTTAYFAGPSSPRTRTTTYVSEGGSLIMQRPAATSILEQVPASAPVYAAPPPPPPPPAASAGGSVFGAPGQLSQMPQQAAGMMRPQGLVQPMSARQPAPAVTQMAPQITPYQTQVPAGFQQQTPRQQVYQQQAPVMAQPAAQMQQPMGYAMQQRAQPQAQSFMQMQPQSGYAVGQYR